MSTEMSGSYQESMTEELSVAHALISMETIDCQNRATAESSETVQIPDELSNDLSTEHHACAIRTWSLSTDKAFLSNLFQNSNYSEQKQLCYISKFLMGQTVVSTTKDLLDFLGTNPEQMCGQFLVALMVTEFIITKCDYAMREELKLASLKAKSPPQHMMIQLLDNRFVKVPDLDLPDFTNCNEKTTTSMDDVQCIYEVIKTLLQLINQDLRSGTARFFDDKSVDNMERLKTWTNVLYVYTKAVYGQISPPHPYNVLLIADSKNKVNTVEYLKICNSDGLESLMLHSHVADKCFNSTPNADILVNATGKDVDVFLELVYYEYNVENLKGKITLGVYNVAKELKPKPDIVGFLFRNHFYTELMNRDNFTNILQILMDLGKENEIDHLASGIKSWFIGYELYKCLNRLPANVFVNVLKRKTLDLHEIEVYWMVIQWSHAAAGIDCSDAMTALSNDKTQPYFDQVCTVLHLVDLKGHYGQIVRQGFLKSADIRNVLELNEIQEIWGPMETHYSLEPRKKL